MNTLQQNLPGNHPDRQSLNDEVHARPPVSMQAPMRASYILCFSNPDSAEKEHQAICDLAAAYGVAAPDIGDNHFIAQMGPLQVKWERHTEFIGYTFIADGLPDKPFAEPAINLVPEDWLASLPGKVFVATHVSLITDDSASLDHERFSEILFEGNVLIGAGIADNAGIALTDFRIHNDGFSRFVVVNRNMPPRQAGRMIQRLLEIESYRMMALLALPVARSLSPFLSKCEKELVQITHALTSSEECDELALLNRLTRLQADIESRYSNSKYRFDAANAYYALVQRCIVDLRESRIQGLQKFQEFTERRLAPAMYTCRAVAERQNSLSLGVARATQLLSTRVDMARREQNQAVLESMNRRAGLQLRLQEAVETVSMVAVTYYMVGLIGYASYGLGALGVSVNSNLITAASIPVVTLAVILVVRRFRKIAIKKEEAS